MTKFDGCVVSKFVFINWNKREGMTIDILCHIRTSEQTYYLTLNWQRSDVLSKANTVGVA